MAYDFTEAELEFLKLIFSLAEQIACRRLFDYSDNPFDSDTLFAIKEKLGIYDLIEE